MIVESMSLLVAKSMVVPVLGMPLHKCLSHITPLPIEIVVRLEIYVLIHKPKEQPTSSNSSDEDSDE